MAGLYRLELARIKRLAFFLIIIFELSCAGVSRTPLHYAAANCNYQCLFALVGSGASVNDLDERGCTPLHYAAASDTDGKYVFHINSVIKEGSVKDGLCMRGLLSSLRLFVVAGAWNIY